MNLFFEHSDGSYTLVAKNITKETVFPKITDYVHILNPNYTIYYIRSWERNGQTIFDVGSHSEFFILTEGVLK